LQFRRITFLINISDIGQALAIGFLFFSLLMTFDYETSTV